MVVEAVDPIILNMRLVDGECPVCGDTGATDVPEFIHTAFETPIDMTPVQQIIYVTLGQFSIIRIERDSQLLVPVYDYCLPDKECAGPCEDDPCALFSRIDFPVDEFFPPDTLACADNYREARGSYACSDDIDLG